MKNEQGYIFKSSLIQPIEKVAKDLRQKYRCQKCGGVISVHNKKCFKCDSITRLVKKPNKKYSR